MHKHTNKPYQTQSAVLLLIFNRPGTTGKVFEQIRLARPSRLYIAADGPRGGIEEDALLCINTREITEHVDWDCEVKRYYRDSNAGCRNGVPEAVSWFFEQETEGVILEDDCLPDNSFFKFCDVMLERYRDDARVRHITGCNLQFGKKWGEASYYFSSRVHVWGWACWKRVWNEYDLHLSKYNENEIEEQLLNIYNDPLIVNGWVDIFKNFKAGRINSWGYALDFINFFNNGLVIIPNRNLVSNIGFNEKATNTLVEDNVYAGIPLEAIEEITHPAFFIPEKRADMTIMERDFKITSASRRKYLCKSWLKVFKRK